MTCSRKSTRWCASALLCGLLGHGVAAQGRPPQAPAGEPPDAGRQETLTVTTEAVVRQAITESVRGRMGPDADVRIETLQTVSARTLTPGNGPLLAQPEPAARLGRTIRFSLSRGTGNDRRVVGYVAASIFVATAHARAARTIQRGETVTAEDITSSRAEVGAVPLQRLPRAADVVGTRAVRDIGPDEVLTRSLVAVKAMVQSGDRVAVRAAAEGVTVQADGVATQSGSAGDTIRVVNPASRRSFRARVLGPGEVEVIQ